MLLDARIASAEEARAAGLVDRVTAGAREAAFLALAGELADAPPPRPRDAGLADPAGYLAEVQRRRAALAAADSPAAPVLVRLVEAALMLPFEAGLEMERAAFADALAAPGTAGLMHVARIEQRPPAAGAAARRLDSAAVLGADDGATLAAQLLGQGLPVRLIDPDGALLEARGRAIATALERGGDDASRLVLSTGLEACAEADLVVVAGRGEIAAEYLSLAGLTAKSGAVIAAFGTDAEPAPVTGRPDDTVWLHWPMQPGTRRHAALAGGGPGARAAVAGLVRRFGRYPVEAAPPPARPALALQATLLRVIERLLLKGAGPGEIDAALARAGWASGPCAMLDAQGLAAAAAEAEAAAAAGWAPEPLGVAATLAEAGLEGKAAGQGLFLYDADGRACGTSAALERAVAGAREAAPEGPEIVERVLAALALCGLRLVRDGAVATAADVDLVALHVLAMPRDWGGPMGAAQSRGLLWLRGALRHFGEDDPDLWEKPAEIDRMIRDKIPLSSDL
jgi:3-hydroxyacyl-CoA dehydrogenase